MPFYSLLCQNKSKLVLERVFLQKNIPPGAVHLMIQRQEEKRMNEKDDGISRITFIDFLARVFPDIIGSCRRIFNLYGNPTVVCSPHTHVSQTDRAI